jgi:small conductance mechanosensitive channel
VAAQIVAYVLRRLLHSCGGLADWAGSRRLQAAGAEAVRRAETVLFWLTLLITFLITAAGVAYHLAGRDVRDDAGDLLARRTAEELLDAGLRLGGLTGLLAGLWVGVRCVRRLRSRLEGPLAAWLGHRGDQSHLRQCFVRLERFGRAAVGLVAAWGAVRVLALPAPAEKAVALIAQLMLILAGVSLLPRAARALTGTALDLGDRYLGQGRSQRYWEGGRRLVPFAQRCFDAAVYVYAATLVVRQAGFLAGPAGYGPKVVQCIGIFFGCRVVIELSQVLLGEAFGLYDGQRPADPKGQTLVPLLQSVCQYLLLFGSAVVMLGVLGVNTGPLLAGAGLVGLAVGLGAQSLVTDVVSGFFILFEGQYLVGDLVQIGAASGRVEAVSIRHTQVRDAHGKLHIIPNGQIKEVVNSSKGYMNAIVDLQLPADGDLDSLLGAMHTAGERLRQEHADDVLAPTEVKGLVDLGPSAMTVRAVTRVRPGKHEELASAYRRLVKQVLDERQAVGRARQAA